MRMGRHTLSPNWIDCREAILTNYPVSGAGFGQTGRCRSGTADTVGTDCPTDRKVLFMLTRGDAHGLQAGSDGVTLQDYIKVFRHRWPVIVICALVAGAVTWFITPASSDTTKKVGSYTATATILVGSTNPESGGAQPGAHRALPDHRRGAQARRRRRSSSRAIPPCSPPA